MVNSTVDGNADFDLNSECSKGSVITIEDKTREFMNLIKNEMKMNEEIRFDISSPDVTNKLTSDSDQDSDSHSDDEDDKSLI